MFFIKSQVWVKTKSGLFKVLEEVFVNEGGDEAWFEIFADASGECVNLESWCGVSFIENRLYHLANNLQSLILLRQLLLKHKLMHHTLKMLILFRPLIPEIQLPHLL